MQYNDAMDTTVCTPHISFLALPTHYQWTVTGKIIIWSEYVVGN